MSSMQHRLRDGHVGALGQDFRAQLCEQDSCHGGMEGVQEAVGHGNGENTLKRSTEQMDMDMD
jgi:hypothetical protein